MIIIDTREQYEYEMGHVESAINISPMELMRGLPTQLNGVPKDEQIVLYCRSGQRSNTCSMILRQYGFTKLVNGINEQHVRKMIQA
ncbi:rhodanese-like domain-containing protein [Candidatus Saccharibacteria bacterium]|nr:rhodanese-like domain-containing protein [Candidatus Saccharibacteria bacterium]